MLRDEVEKIISKNRIDAVYAKKGIFMNWKEVCMDFACSFFEIIENPKDSLKIAVYPGGYIGKNIADHMTECGYHIEYMIDNYTKTKEYRGIPVLTYDEWVNKNCTDIVLVCSEYKGESFTEQLTLDGYTGKVLDVYKYLNNIYHNLEIVPSDDISRMARVWNYLYINELELKYASASDSDREETLKALIYGLFIARDFCYAEKYIEELSKPDDFKRYRKAIEEIKEAICKVVENKENENVWFIHIIDSLADYCVDKMPALKKIAESGIRLKGMTTQYPCTHYAVNTLFTGKGVFDIELGTDEIEWDDSELLEYLKKEQMKVTYISVKPDKPRIGKLANFKYKIRENGIAYIMFEGLCCLEEVHQNHIIALHSVKEVHIPYYSVGGGKKLKSIGWVPAGYDYASKNEISSQFARALSYVDKQMEWYYSYYDKAGCANLIMGDHGGSDEYEFHLFYGLKKDFGMMNKECLTPAFIISGSDAGKTIEGIISNIKIPDILLDLLKERKSKDLYLEKYVQEYAFVGAVPAYSQGNVDIFLPRQIYGCYEGFIGIRTKDEIYLLSASGREVYYRPDECRYRNLVNDKNWSEAVENCKNLIKGMVYPIEIYRLGKYKYHLEMLEKYDGESYSKIKQKLELSKN